MMVPRTIEQMVAVFRDLPLEFAPGEKFKYNNSGYFLLGVIIEKVAGKKYEDALGDEIFTPLGMKDTGYDWSEPLLPRRAVGLHATRRHAGSTPSSSTCSSRIRPARSTPPSRTC